MPGFEEDKLIDQFKSCVIDKAPATLIDNDNKIECIVDVTITYKEDDDSDEEVITRGPIIKTKTQRPTPYTISYNGSTNLYTPDECFTLYECLTPPESVHLSPCKDLGNYDSNNQSPKILCMDSPLFTNILNDSDSGTYSRPPSISENIFNDDDTPFWIGDPYLVTKFLNTGLDNDYDEKGIHLKNNDVMTKARIDVAKMTEAEITQIISDGDSSLIVATAKNQICLVIALVERLHRMNQHIEYINHTNNMGITALYCAVINNSHILVHYLIQNGANANFFYTTQPKDKNNTLRFQLIHCAAERGVKYLETLKALLSASNLEIDSCNNRGCTPLLCAIERHNLETNNSLQTIKLLVQHGANLMQTNTQSFKIPLQIAIERGAPELVELILSLAYEIDVMNESAMQQLPLNTIDNGGNLNMENYQVMEKYIGSYNTSEVSFHTNAYDQSKVTYQYLYPNSLNVVPNDPIQFDSTIPPLHAPIPTTGGLTGYNNCLPLQIQQYNCMTKDGRRLPCMYQSKKERDTLVNQMLNFRSNSRSEFSMLGCAYDVCALFKEVERPKKVVKILLEYGATVAPKSRPHPISNLEEFKNLNRKK